MSNTKKSELQALYSKFVKLATKLDKEKNELVKKSQELKETETSIETISNAIFQNTLSDYVIDLKTLRTLLGKKEEIPVEEVIQTCIKYAVNKLELTNEFSKDTKKESIDVWVCSCEGRMNVCYSDEKPQCPITTKACCDGAKMSALFLKKGE